MNHLVVFAVLLSACAPSVTQRGRGATHWDRPIVDDHRRHHVWGLVNKGYDWKQLCPNGDILVEESGRPFASFTVIGLAYYRTRVQAWCRDDVYRAEALRRFELQQQIAAAQAAERASQQQIAEANLALYRAQNPSPPEPVSAPSIAEPEVAVESQAAPAAVESQAAPAAVESQAAPAGFETQPQVVRPQHSQAQPRPRTNVVRVERTASSMPHTTQTHTVRSVSNHIAEAHDARQCDAAIPAVNDKNPMMAAQLTRSKREPCMRCIGGGKAFFVYAGGSYTCN
jgi:hypothetical protein